jgi:exodeoxyribonuclease V gamma subunit
LAFDQLFSSLGYTDNHMQDVYLSNQLECLADSLKQNLFNGLSPFKKQMVIVPSHSIRNYLALRLAQDPHFRIFAGMHFFTLIEALAEFSREEKRIPVFLELSLSIEREIYRLIEEKDELIQQFKTLFSSRKQIAHGADQLSRLFLHYGIFCGQSLPIWLQENGWQQKIWQSLFSSSSKWTYAVSSLNVKRALPFPIHLVGFSFLPQLYFQFFHAMGSHFYLLSPCQYFWSDLYSDRQRMRIHQKMTKKEDVDAYFRAENRLLSNFGAMGKACARMIEERECTTEEHYVETKGSALRSLQSDLLNLRAPLKQPLDHSLQLFSAPSKLLEVELLQQNIAKWLAEDTTRTASDILVLSPEIDAYLPFLHFVLLEKIPYKIEQIKNDALLTAAFQQLLQLPRLRFEAQSLLKLLSYPSFLKKCGLTDQDAAKIKKWTKIANIQWGFCEKQRELFLQAPAERQGTWCDGLDRLLENLCIADEKREAIELTDAELLGDWAQLIFSLNRDLSPILETDQKPLYFWIDWVQQLSEKYFSLSDEERAIFQQLDSLRSLNFSIPFESLERVLNHLLERKNGSFQASHLHAMTFTSFDHGNVVPAKLIYLLGMDEEAFPRHSSHFFSSLNHLQKMDYFPTKNEEDRFLFLEALLSARENLWISYVKKDPRDGKELAASLLVQEVFAEITSTLSEIDYHPPLKKTIPALFLPELHENIPFKAPKKEKNLIIDLKHLSLLARHPIRFFLNRTLGIYLKQEQEDAEFTLSLLNKAIVREQALRDSPDVLLERAAKEGKLPQGIFKAVAEKRILQEIEERDLALKYWGIEKSELFSVEFKGTCQEPLQRENSFFYPPLHVSLPDGRVAHIVGSFDALSSQGLLFHGKDTLKDKIKAWPLFLIAQHVPMLQHQPLLMMQGKEKLHFDSLDPQKALAQYITYYELACVNLSPLMPDWAAAFLKGECTDVKKAIGSSRSHFSKDPYLQWLFSRDPLPNAEVLFDRWSSILRETHEAL